MKKAIFILIIWYWGGGRLSAQNTEGPTVFGNALELLKLGEHDGTALMEAYTRPVTERMIYQSVSPGFEPFRKDKKFKWAFQIHMTNLIIPAKYTDIPLSSLGLENWESQDIFNLNLRTYITKDTMYGFTTMLISSLRDSLDNAAFAYETPAGPGYMALPQYALTFSFHILPTTILRTHTNFLYNNDILGLPFFMLGTGIQQDLFALWGIRKETTAFTLNMDYTFIHAEKPVNIVPRDGEVDSNGPVTGNHNGPYKGQKIHVNLTGIAFGGYYGLHLGKYFWLYGGSRYLYGYEHIRFEGIFPAYRPAADGSFALEKYDIAKMPDIKKNFGGFSAEAGFALDWEIITVRLELMYLKYPGINFAVGLQF